MASKKDWIQYFKHLTRYFMFGVVGFSLTVGAWFGLRWFYYTHLDGYSLSTIVEPIEILNPGHEIRIGEPIVMRQVINKPENIHVKEFVVNITCDDSNLVTLAPAERASSLQPGEWTIIVDDYTLPNKVTVGTRCVFNFINVYQPNPYTEETIKWSSEEFTVGE